MENVVITGIGIISALGNGIKSNTDALMKGLTGIGRMEHLEVKHREFPVGEVKYGNMEMRKNMKLADEGTVSRTSILGIAAAREAVEMAGINSQMKELTTLITGTTTAGTDVIEDHYFEMFAKKEYIADIDYRAAYMSTAMISHYLGLLTRHLTVTTAESSALNAIILGTRLVRSGRNKIVIAGGSESLSKFHFNGVRSLRIMDNRVCRPFDRQRSGMNLGEGAAYLVLERESDARKRGAKILAYITGFGNACDAFSQSSTSPDGQGAYLAMKSALESAGLKPGDIDYINAHGTGTVDNDLSESNAIKRLFGNKIPPISSTKGFTGTSSASGAMEAIFSILSMQNNFIPTNLGWRNCIEGGIVPTRGRTGVRLRHIMCNSFGTGGNDSSIIISSSPTDNWKDIQKVETEIITGRELDEESELQRITNYTNHIMARKMGRLMKASAITAMDLLKQNGLERPDAIISCTFLGMVENCEQFMQDIRKNGEDTPKPAIFMQCAHNTLASNIAMLTKCHGYNTTYAENNINMALIDAQLLIEEGLAETVLIGYHEETTDYYRKTVNRLEEIERVEQILRKRISSQCFLLRKK